MTQITVEELYEDLKQLVESGAGNKKIVVADDSEGNGYHGAYYVVIADPRTIEYCITYSNGLTDSLETDYNNIVIIG